MKRLSGAAFFMSALLVLFAASAFAADAKIVSEGQKFAESAASPQVEIRSPLEGMVLQGGPDDTVTLAWRFLKGPVRFGKVRYRVTDADTGVVYLNENQSMREYYWQEWGYYDEFDFSREVAISQLGGPGRRLVLTVRYDNNPEASVRFSVQAGEAGNAPAALQAPPAVRTAVDAARGVMDRLEWRSWIRVWRREKNARRIWHYSVNAGTEETLRYASLLSFQSGRQEADAVDDAEILRVMHFFESEHTTSVSVRYSDEKLPAPWEEIGVKFQSVASTEGQQDFEACGWKFSVVVTEMTWNDWLKDEVLLLAQAPYTRAAGFEDSYDEPGEHRVAVLVSAQDKVKEIVNTLTGAGYLTLPESVRDKLFSGKDCPGGILQSGDVKSRPMVTIRDGGDVNVRNQPASGAHRIAKAKGGESYPLLENTGKGWLLIELPDGKKGYISDGLIK